nr:hypothetical protein [Citrobacter amalonaticus]
MVTELQERRKVTAPPAPEDYFSSLVSAARLRADKAMRKYQQPNYVLNKVAEESGEVIKEVIHYTEGRGDWNKVEYELIDNLAMLIRLVTEGDQVIGFTPPDVCRDAKGSQPVSNRDELPLDYLQGHKDGLEWAAQLAEANHPQTGDWLYDDPTELAKAIRKGPDMPPVEPGNSPVIPDGWKNCKHLLPIGELICRLEEQTGEKWIYAKDAIPVGYALVPVEPTPEMLRAGFLAGEDYPGGVYRDMIAAAPQ